MEFELTTAIYAAIAGSVAGSMPAAIISYVIFRSDRRSRRLDLLSELIDTVNLRGESSSEHISALNRLSIEFESMEILESIIKYNDLLHARTNAEEIRDTPKFKAFDDLVNKIAEKSGRKKIKKSGLKKINLIA